MTMSSLRIRVNFNEGEIQNWALKIAEGSIYEISTHFKSSVNLFIQTGKVPERQRGELMTT